MFSVEYRNQVQEFVLALASADPRISAGAVVGSLALSDGDRWSDLDLTFGVAAPIPISDVLEDWTLKLTQSFQAVKLFDLQSGPSIYRVFLLPGCLQFDLSFTPEDSFGASGPKFRLLFGNAVKKPFPKPAPAAELFGYAVHHALRARFCIERGRYWQAEYWISGVRDYALSLACLRRDLSASHARGYDNLPPEVLALFEGGLVRTLEPTELQRALNCVIQGLLTEAKEVEEIANKAEPQLRELMAD